MRWLGLGDRGYQIPIQEQTDSEHRWVRGNCVALESCHTAGNIPFEDDL